MGRAIADRIEAAPDLELGGVWRRGGDIHEVAAQSAVLIDFSLPEALSSVLAGAKRKGIPLVCGVSGLDEQQLADIRDAAQSVAVVYDRNMSAGVAVLENVVRQAAATLGPDFGVQVHETHHVHKIDAPSGTALKLGEAIADSLGIDPGDVHYESERRGEVPGDHTVILSSDTETLSFHHSVTTRDVFADGALRAARWVIGKPPGLYSMQDVLV
mgnify:CR=1 FL=1